MASSWMPLPPTMVCTGQVLAIAGRREPMMQMSRSFGPEVDDRQLLDFPAESVDVVVTSKELPGKTLKELAERENGERSRGVFLRKLTRAEVSRCRFIREPRWIAVMC